MNKFFRIIIIMSYNLIRVSSISTPKHFYVVSQYGTYKKLKMLKRIWRVRNENRINHSPYLSIFPNVALEIINKYSTRQEGYKEVERLRRLSPDCLNRKSYTYSTDEEKREYKQRKATAKIYCEYCNRSYHKDYFKEHLTRALHMKNVKEKTEF